MNGLYEFSSGLLAGAFAFLIFALTIIILYVFNKDEILIAQRISKIVKVDRRERRVELSKKSKKKKFSTDKVTTKIIETIGEELLLANIIMKPEEFIILWIVVIFVPGGLVALLTAKMVPAFTLVALGVVLPPVIIRNKKNKRVVQFENQLGDALVVIGNCMRSGLTFQQAMESISREMPDPIAREFGRAVREIKYGNTVEKALNNMSDRIKSQDLMLTVSAVLIQRQVGGNLSEVLEKISDTIKERLKIKNEIRVLTSTGRMSGVVIGLLPIAIGVILLLVNSDYMMKFFDSQIGTIMLVVGAVLEIIGFVVVRKIVSVKY